jgi:7-alpha-hydroxysteroid dehydrogenase
VNVAFTYNSNDGVANDIITDVESKYGVKARAYKLNILEPEEYKEVYKAFDEDFDRLDYFISNAIISGRAVVGGFGPFMRLKPKGLNNIYIATVDAFVVGAQEASKRMEKIGGGAIISMSSTGNLVYTPNYAGHGTNKAAVEAMVRYAAAELGEKGIRVNAVSGGPIDTDALRAFPNYEEVKSEVVRRSPLSRMGEAQDLTGACLFLCSNASSWLTGQTIVIDGGTTFQ